MAPVQVEPGPVVASGGGWVGVAGEVLYVPERYTGVERQGDRAILLARRLVPATTHLR